jgi:hypothetical protein
LDNQWEPAINIFADDLKSEYHRTNPLDSLKRTTRQAKAQTSSLAPTTTTPVTVWPTQPRLPYPLQPHNLAPSSSPIPMLKQPTCQNGSWPTSPTKTAPPSSKRWQNKLGTMWSTTSAGNVSRLATIFMSLKPRPMCRPYSWNTKPMRSSASRLRLLLTIHYKHAPLSPPSGRTSLHPPSCHSAPDPMPPHLTLHEDM